MGVLLPRKKGLRSRKNQAGQGDEVDGGGRRPRSSSGKLPSLCIPGGSQTRGNDPSDDPGRAAASRGPSAAEAAAGDCRQSLRQRSVAEAFAAARDRTDLPAQKESRPACHAGWSRTAALQKALDRGTDQRLARELPALGRALRPLARNLRRVLSHRLLHDRLTEGCAIASSLILPA